VTVGERRSLTEALCRVPLRVGWIEGEDRF
jgi:hypothetical protein